MTIVILGAGGQLGQALRRRFPEATALTRSELDIGNPAAILNYDWRGVDVVINAAAYTKVDDAELEENEAILSAVNVDGPRHLAEAAALHGFILVHLSSDYVFDGTHQGHILETLALSPLSRYGTSKAASEIDVGLTVPHAYIVRTSWVLGGENDFVHAIARKAKEGATIRVVADQRGRPTFTWTLANAIAHLLEVRAPYGIYNCSNSGPTATWYEIACQTYEGLGANSQHVRMVKTDEYYAGLPHAAARPRNSLFALDKLIQTGFTPAGWEGELDHYLKGIS